MEWIGILLITACIGVGTAVTFDHNKSGQAVFETPHIPNAEHDELVAKRDRLLAEHAELTIENDRLTAKLNCLTRRNASCK